MVCIEIPWESQWHVIQGQHFRLDALHAPCLRSRCTHAAWVCKNSRGIRGPNRSTVMLKSWGGADSFLMTLKVTRLVTALPMSRVTNGAGSTSGSCGGATWTERFWRKHNNRSQCLLLLHLEQSACVANLVDMCSLQTHANRALVVEPCQIETCQLGNGWNCASLTRVNGAHHWRHALFTHAYRAWVVEPCPISTYQGGCQLGMQHRPQNAPWQHVPVDPQQFWWVFPGCAGLCPAVHLLQNCRLPDRSEDVWWRNWSYGWTDVVLSLWWWWDCCFSTWRWCCWNRGEVFFIWSRKTRAQLWAKKKKAHRPRVICAWGQQLQTRLKLWSWHGANFLLLHSNKNSFWRLILNPEQIYRLNMNTFECHFHGETAVHILFEEDAFSVHTRPVPGWHKSLKAFEMIDQSFLPWAGYVRDLGQWAACDETRKDLHVDLAQYVMLRPALPYKFLRWTCVKCAPPATYILVGS